MWVDSESELGERLAVLPRMARCAFSVVCAQLLFPLYVVYESKYHKSDHGSRSISQALDSCWMACLGADPPVAEQLSAVESLMPCDDDAWVWESGLAESAVAATMYALRSWTFDDAQEGVWAARQAYEAVDHVAYRNGSDHDDGSVVGWRMIMESESYASIISRLDAVLIRLEANHLGKSSPGKWCIDSSGLVG